MNIGFIFVLIINLLMSETVSKDWIERNRLSNWKWCALNANFTTSGHRLVNVTDNQLLIEMHNLPQSEDYLNITRLNRAKAHREVVKSLHGTENERSIINWNWCVSMVSCKTIPSYLFCLTLMNISMNMIVSSALDSAEICQFQLTKFTLSRCTMTRLNDTIMMYLTHNRTDRMNNESAEQKIAELQQCDTMNACSYCAKVTHLSDAAKSLINNNYKNRLYCVVRPKDDGGYRIKSSLSKIESEEKVNQWTNCMRSAVDKLPLCKRL